MKILLVEDERRMADLLRQGLSEEGHAVTTLGDGRAALSAAECGGFDLLILDVMLPGLTGLEIARRLRAGRDRTPILMLTARDSNEDIVRGLDVGADDYLTKPFSFDVLLARVRATGRRGPLPRPLTLEAGDLRMDQGAREVWRGPNRIELTRTEYAVLETLMRNAGRVVPRDTLIEAVWSGDGVESNTLDAYVRLLRAKIDRPGCAGAIRTVRGVGYTIPLEHE
ncbi:MAG: response regulator transcription factor [Acidobacteria bacterium]|nr:response regulator transcription factor [Acidobacteriota bacterium]